MLILLGTIFITMASLNIFRLGKTTNYVKDIGLLLTWLFAWLLAVLVSARELPSEESKGTIFSLLAKPVKRSEIIIGKWLGSWTIVTVATLFFYAMVIAVVKMKGGTIILTTFAQAFVLHSVLIAVVCSLAIWFSTRMHSDAASTLTFIVTTVSFFVVPQIPHFLTKETGSTAWLLMFTYNLFPHFEVFDMRQNLVNNYGIINWKIFAYVISYGALLTSIMLSLAWISFRKKTFSRGNLGE